MQVSGHIESLTPTPQVAATESARKALEISRDEESSSKNANDSQRSNQFNVLSEWALAAELSKRIALAEHTEQTIRRVYAQIESIKRELAESKTETISSDHLSYITKELWNIETQIKEPNSGLNSHLNLTSTATITTALLNKQIDLLSPRKQGERLQILIGRTGKAVYLAIPPDNSPESTLEQVQRGFAKHGIQAHQMENGQLAFSVPNEASNILKNPWSFTGEGIRIAAGNPIAVELTIEQGEMKKLVELAREDSHITQYIAELEKRQQALKNTLAELRAELAMLNQELQKLQTQVVDTQSVYALSQQLNTQMQNRHTDQLSIIMAQSGINKNLVNYGLG